MQWKCRIEEIPLNVCGNVCYSCLILLCGEALPAGSSSSLSIPTCGLPLTSHQKWSEWYVDYLSSVGGPVCLWLVYYSNIVGKVLWWEASVCLSVCVCVCEHVEVTAKAGSKHAHCVMNKLVSGWGLKMEISLIKTSPSWEPCGPIWWHWSPSL